MKLPYKQIFVFLRIPIDWIFSMAVVPAAGILLLYRRIGSKRLPGTSMRLKKMGLFPVRNHYYEPLFDHRVLQKPLSDERHLPGIDLNMDGQLALLGTLVYGDELVQMDLRKPSDDPQRFQFGNGSFESGDAEFLYQFIRVKKPSTMIEIGSGNSTKIAQMAFRKNGAAVKHICIEPYEQDWLEQMENIEVIRKRVEDCEIDWATALKAGDLLFIDSSHIIRPQGDVLKEFLEILPVLASGVYVHIHDIFTPRDYLQIMVVEDVRFWNEQYLLEALLAHSQRYEVIGAINYLRHHCYDALKKACPYLTPDREPGSFYIKIR